MANTIECPNCANSILLPREMIIFEGACPRCRAGFRIRKGHAFRAEEIVDNKTYCIIVLFAQISRANLEYSLEYDKFVEEFIKRQNLTKTQYNDITLVYKNEKKNFFHEKTKDIINSLKKDIDISCKAMPMQEQEALENGILSILYKMTLIGKGQNEEQLKIINLYRSIFMISDERMESIVDNFNEKIEKEVNFEEVFNNIKNSLENTFYTDKDRIKELLVAFKRPFIIQNNVSLPKNIIAIFTNETDIMYQMVSTIANKMQEEIIIRGGVAKLDCSLYNSENVVGNFINDFNNILISKQEVVVIENFKALSDRASMFLCNTLKNGFEVVNTSQGQVKIACNNKFFCFLITGEEKEFINRVGEEFYSSINDIIKVYEFSDEEINQMIANYANWAVMNLRNNLELNLYYDVNVIDFIKKFYSKNTGMKSIKNVPAK